ncbi:hypothetical protein K458DRAFT_414729 [Lentithecium fluviatile CBS 122367]|uniref:Zn(2)-C6 fungal-type domain-containing protein n=1 Tax=Lentithecium fluviatile CBS 122367 TaxID=1168545 RepID=A0A6G1JBZ0_9PLEO|nr:hypothetical protein K458DRAFT_414729 [Lentithecium fluviatile CBS 122367]
MVGVPKSTGCFICRKRKIKCDETWPSCINCGKNGKSCPGPPARHTFKDLGPRLNSHNGVVSVEELSGVLDPRNRRLMQLNEKWSENGAVIHKFRISHKGQDQSRKVSRSPRPSSKSPSQSPQSPFNRQPSPSQHQELARALLEAMSTGGVGHRMSAFGPFIREVPGRIGHNPALDAAVACLVHAHASLVHKKPGNEIANPQLYLRAVQTLQTCLEDPQQGRSPNTLCASVLLGLVEALAGPRVNNRYLAHVGGAGRLMELQGPEQCRDSFAKEMLRFNRGGIIITSIYKRAPCFLTSPEWRDIAFDKTGLSFDDCLYTDILLAMANFPALLNELKGLDALAIPPMSDLLSYDFSLPMNMNADDQSTSYPSLDLSNDPFDPNLDLFTQNFNADTSHEYSTARINLVNKLHQLKGELNALGTHLTAKLADGSAAIELPAIEDGSPVPTAFHFSNWRVTVAYNCYWALLILTNKIIMKLLPPYDPTHYALEAECRTVALEICKTWEDAWTSKPIGAFHTGLSFVMAYEFCTTDVREWILRGLNALLDHQNVETFRWSDDVIAMMSGKLCGEGPDLVFSHVK